MNLSAREFVYRYLDSIVARTRKPAAIDEIDAWVKRQYIEPHARQVQDLRETNAALRRQVEELSAALTELYQSASILYDTPEANTTVWTINLKKHKKDLEQARAALARQEVTE